MSKILEPIERSRIADRVRDALAKYQPRSYQISVDEVGISQDDDWYHVLVTTPNHQRDRDFYDALAMAEADLEKSANGSSHYLLVPVLG